MKLALPLVMAIVVSVILISPVASVPPEVSYDDWTLDIRISSGVVTQDLALGTAGAATSGFDASYDVPAPPVSPGATKDFYLSIDDPFFNRLGEDYRPTLTHAYPSESWLLRIQSDEEILLSWDPAGIPAYLSGVEMQVIDHIEDMSILDEITLPPGDYSIPITAFYDTVAPDIVIVDPTPGAIISPAPAEVDIIAYFDDEGRIDRNSIIMIVDGTDVTSATTSSSADDIIYTFSAEEGSHAVEITVADVAGNVATESWSFEVRDSVSVDTPIAAGWNLISIPLENAEYEVPTGMLPVAYWYDPAKQAYVTLDITTAEPGRAYWVAAMSDGILTCHGSPVTGFEAQIKAGWNMIGSLALSTSCSDPVTDPEGAVLPFVYAYDPISQTYYTSQTLECGGGYWAAATQDCVLHVGLTPPLPPGSPDLVISGITWEPEHPVIYENIIFYVEVTNAGTGAVQPGENFKVFTTVDQHAFEWACSGWSTNEGLAAGASTTVTVTGEGCPVPSVDYHTVRVQVDSENDIRESNELNNYYQTTMYIDGGFPDLVVTDIAWSPAAPADGDALTFTATIENIGTAITPVGTEISVRFGTDPDVYPGYQYGDTSLLYSLYPGDSATVSVSSSWQDPIWTLSAGDHVVWAKVDYLDMISESDEENNMRTEIVSVGGPTGPDLVVTDIWWTPASPQSGDAVTFWATIKNQGTGATPAGEVHGVLFTIDDGAAPGVWSDTYTASIPAGSWVTVSATGGSAGATWPATSGSHTVRATVDDQDLIAERNEGNNALTETVFVGASGSPDLIVTDISWSPESPQSGDMVRFSAVIKNQGTVPTPAGEVHGVLFTIDDGAVPGVWSDWYIDSIPAGRSVTVFANGGSAGAKWLATEGLHTVRATVDDQDLIAEGNEGNNALTETLVVGASGSPDLIVTDISWEPANPQSGDAVTFWATIKNQGTGPTPAGEVHGVLFTIDDGAVPGVWSDTYIDSIPAGDWASVSANGGSAGATWLATLGSHTVRATVDDQDRIAESNEENNMRTETVPVGIDVADLVVTDIAWTPQSPDVGDEVTFEVTVANTGTGSTPEGVPIEVELDNVRDAFSGGPFLGSYAGSLAPGETVTVAVAQEDGTDTWEVVRGENKLGALVDPGDLIAESDELNNYKPKFLNAGLYDYPDLVVTGISWSPSSPKAGDAVTFSATIRNQGTGATSPGEVHGVLFTIDDGAVPGVWSDWYTDSIPAGSSVTVSANGGSAGATWPATVGSHTVRATVDDQNRILESNEDNNVLTETVMVGASGSPDLIVTDIWWSPSSPQSGDPVTFSATIRNQGTGATPAGEVHGVLFTIDGGAVPGVWSDTYTASIPAGSSVSVMANGGSAGATWTATAGSHTVKATVDDQDRIAESNEGNNVRTETVVV